MSRNWLAVASADHVAIGRRAGFMQVCHGKASPLQRIQPGDRIVYYSPRERMNEGEPLQAFTAIGEVSAGEPYPFDMGGGFVPYRRAVRFYRASDAPIRPLLPILSFTRGRPNWGMLLRRGLFAIEKADYEIIAKAMQASGTR